MSIKYFGVFESDFVLATLLEPYSQNTDSNSAASSQSSAATPLSSNASNKRKFEDSQVASWSSKASHDPPRMSQGPSPASYSPSSVVRSDSSASQVIRSNDTHQNQQQQQIMDVDDMDYGDYEEEVQGTPSPQDKRMRYTEEGTNDTVQVIQGGDDDDEEIPCSVEE